LGQDDARRAAGRASDREMMAIAAVRSCPWKPLDWAAITFTAAAQRRRDSDMGSGIPLNGNTEARVDPAALISHQPRLSAFDTDSFVRSKRHDAFRGVFNRVPRQLTTISARTRASVDIAYDADRANSQIIRTAYIHSQTERLTSQELSYSSDEIGRIKYLLVYDTGRWGRFQDADSRSIQPTA
jgi:hypothetical protein